MSSNTLTYRGYTARIEFDADDGILVGEVLGLNDRITFHAEKTSELADAFEEAVDHYLRDCEATGRAPDKPASGRILLRIAPEIHARASVAAQSEGKSLNQWIADALARATRHTHGGEHHA